MMSKIIVSVFLFGLVASPAQAVVKITGVAGASRYSIVTGVTTKIYGGRGGSTATQADCEASTSNTETCNGCALATISQVCNRSRIYSNLRLRISFTSDTAAGRPFVGKPNVSSVLEIETGSVAKGATATVDVFWSVICAALTNGTSTCDPTLGNISSEGDLVVGIDGNGDGVFSTGDDSAVISFKILDPDPDGTLGLAEIADCTANALLASPEHGLCGFLAYPGDKKIYAEDLEGGGSFPTTNAGTIKFINFYYQKTDFNGFSPSVMTPKTVEVELTSSNRYELVDKIIDGLDNLSPYFFRVSSSDEAGNEMYFTSNTAITADCSAAAIPLAPLPPFDGTSGGELCPWAAVPDEVLGLLNDDINCFIATAAFGSSFHPFVEDLREFRNKFLNPFKFGRGFVNWYYSWSPRAAHWLKDHDWAKPVVKGALVPVWLFTQAMIWWPITLVALITFFLMRRRRA